MTAYAEFLATKAETVPAAGIEPGPLHSGLYPFQQDLVAWAVRRGRAALFADTGLGKTRMQVEWCRQVLGAASNRALILAPLAVAHQTIREAAEIGVDVRYAREQGEVQDGVTITNYDRLDRFEVGRFGAVVLDESSILKAFMGATKRALVESCRSVPFRLACTATPAPNDHMEIGNHSEWLGVLEGQDMLARWFINDTSTFGTYRLKGHAVRDFWDWVISWGRCVGKPSDLGYDDAGFALPPLDVRHVEVPVDITDDRGGMLFRLPELSATNVHAEKRKTAPQRAAKVAELVAAEPDEPWLVWCETDYEADALLAAIPEAVDVRGSQSVEVKEQRLMDFAAGRIRVLVTKPSLAGFGLNFQHCARVAFVGVSYSYEQLYQAIRRCWRYGQKRPVLAYVVLAATEHAVLDAVLEKQAAHEAMKRSMFEAMRRATARESRKAPYLPSHRAPLPAWLREVA